MDLDRTIIEALAVCIEDLSTRQNLDGYGYIEDGSLLMDPLVELPGMQYSGNQELQFMNHPNNRPSYYQHDEHLRPEHDRPPFDTDYLHKFRSDYHDQLFDDPKSNRPLRDQVFQQEYDPPRVRQQRGSPSARHTNQYGRQYDRGRESTRGPHGEPFDPGQRKPTTGNTNQSQLKLRGLMSNPMKGEDAKGIPKRVTGKVTGETGSTIQDNEHPENKGVLMQQGDTQRQAAAIISKRPEQNYVCGQCQEKGHYPSNCPNTKCSRTKCKGLDHTNRDCPSKVCGRCNKQGHVTIDCPTRASILKLATEKTKSLEDNEPSSINSPGQSTQLPALLPTPQLKSVQSAVTASSGNVCAQCKEKGHYPSNCPNTKCSRTKCKGLDHTSRDCPSKVCGRCNKQGHVTIDCPTQGTPQQRPSELIQSTVPAVMAPSSIVCMKCKEVGHLGLHCPHDDKKVCCALCKDLCHYTKDCPKRVCAQCKGKGHFSIDCPNTKCSRVKCKGLDHSKRDCPNKVCMKCKEVGHLGLHCPHDDKKVCCAVCKDLCHYTKDCPKRVCMKCKGVGHLGSHCPHDDKKVCCALCKDLCHYTKDCPKRGTPQQGLSESVQSSVVLVPAVSASSNAVCAQCKEKGHYPSNCPNTKCSRTKCKGLDHTSRDCPSKVCGRCNKQGHVTIDCPTRASILKVATEKDKEPSSSTSSGQSTPLPSLLSISQLKSVQSTVTASSNIVCVNCKKTGHKETECLGAYRSVVITCDSCKDTDHFARDCPNRRCLQCKITDHSRGECRMKICLKCWGVGHQGANCPQDHEKVSCQICNDQGHYTEDCPLGACTHCKSENHISSNCPNTRCLKSKCWSSKHSIGDCPNIVCDRCKKDGHITSDCRTEACSKCKNVGHSSDNCPHDKKVSTLTKPKAPIDVLRTYPSDDKKCLMTQCRGLDHTIRYCPNRACSRCNRTGHAAIDCPPEVCSKCKNSDHKTENCPLVVKVCAQCREIGHYFSDCPNSKCSRPKCVGLVHTMRDCPSNVCAKSKERGHYFSSPNTKCSRDECSGLVHTTRDCPYTDCVQTSSAYHGKRHSTQVLENSEIKTARFTGEPHLLPKHATPRNTHPALPPKEPLNVSDYEVTGSVGNDAASVGKRQSCQGSENNEIKRARINEEPQGVPKVCFKCEEPGHFSKDCPICIKCKDAGHFTEECTTKVCSLCKQKGHFGISCFNKDAVCSNCKGRGHWMRECPETLCNQCKQKGHLPADCPNTICFTCVGAIHSRRNCHNKASKPMPTTQPMSYHASVPSLQSIQSKNVAQASNKNTGQTSYSSYTSKLTHLSAPTRATTGDSLPTPPPSVRNAAQRPASVQSATSAHGSVVCAQCRENGHYFSDCPNTKCSRVNCRSLDHSKRDCPNKATKTMPTSQPMSHPASVPSPQGIQSKNSTPTSHSAYVDKRTLSSTSATTGNRYGRPATLPPSCPASVPSYPLAYNQKEKQSSYKQNVGRSTYSQTSRQGTYSQNTGQSDRGEPVPGHEIVTVTDIPQRQPSQRQPPTNSSSETAPSDTIYVCNLPTPCSATMLRDLCQKAGEVTYVAIMGANTGIVTYEAIYMAEQAVSLLDHTDFHNSTIIVGFFNNSEALT